MKLIVGLGNPGRRYEKTRHNAGFMFLDRIKDVWNLGDFTPQKNSLIIKTKDIILAKPQTYMNDSGRAVSSLASYYKIKPDDIYIVHDDLDLRIGTFKIQKGTSPKDHKGIESINKELGITDYWHIRIGIDNRDRENRIDGETYVLQNFTDEEFEILKETINNIIRSDIVDKILIS